jgi:hypothetical protein
MTQSLLDQARTFFRTVGPKTDSEFIAVNNCTSCKREHKTYLCKKCDFQTWAKWKMQIHIAADTRECNYTAQQRQKEWADS